MAATSLYGQSGDAGDAFMARWLQSAGLQHLASPLASDSTPDLLMEGYGAKSTEEKQRVVNLMRNLNFRGESSLEPYVTASQSVPNYGFHSPEFKGQYGAGLLDLHAMDDTELLPKHVTLEPFEPSSLFMSGPTTSLDNTNLISTKQQRREGQSGADASAGAAMFEKAISSKENNVAKIRVVVRKRPLNKKELSQKEEDIVTISDNALTVHEPKLKVDLTAYVEKHQFCFDAILDEHVTNDKVTVEPIIPTIFQGTKTTCFAFGQTGSGKTFTMKPLPIRATEDLVRLLHQPANHNQRFKLWLSYFEIYGGKLFDLLCDRKKLCMREDRWQQACIVGLQEFEVTDVQIVKEHIEKGNANRSTGSTSANEESSRSHAILQLVVKRHSEIKDNRRNNDGNEATRGKVIGKISFIDLAGSERGADTTDNDRQTRIEGAEINKSLLALKECIRALENDQIHIPFRGSKLTEVLRDSFIGNSKTVMISCISPNAGSCEHTLNTLRYADRVKSLSRTRNAKKDSVSSSTPIARKESSSVLATQVFAGLKDVQKPHLEARTVDANQRDMEKENFSYNPPTDYDKQPCGFPSSYNYNGRDGSGISYGSLNRNKFEMRSIYGGSTSRRTPYFQNLADAEESFKIASPHRKITDGGEGTEKLGNWLGTKGGRPDQSTPQSESTSGAHANNVPARKRKRLLLLTRKRYKIHWRLFVKK